MTSHTNKHNAFVFTCNNYTPDHVRAIQEFVQEKGRFLLFAYELASTGTPHLQGCFWLNDQIRPDSLCRLCKPGKQLHGFSIRTQRGNMDDQRRYILDAVKDGQPKPWVPNTTPYIWGDWPTNEEFDSQKPQQGKRSDLQDFVALVKQGPISEQTIAEDFTSVLAKYPRFVETVQRIYEPKPTHPGFPELYKWQQDILAQIETTPHKRQMTFIVDKKGEGGKSEFASWLLATRDDVQVSGPMEYKRLAHLYNRRCRVFILDCPRLVNEYPYDFLENLKDGRITQEMYNPIVRSFNRPHVFVFCNHLPDYNKLSADRFVIVNI